MQNHNVLDILFSVLNVDTFFLGLLTVCMFHILSTVIVDTGSILAVLIFLIIFGPMNNAVI